MSEGRRYSITRIDRYAKEKVDLLMVASIIIINGRLKIIINNEEEKASCDVGDDLRVENSGNESAKKNEQRE